MDLYEKQLELETLSVTNGIERYQRELSSKQGTGREFDGGPEAAALNKMMDALVPAIRKLTLDAKKRLKAGYTVGTRLSGWEMPLCTMSPHALAYITVRTALTSAGQVEHRATVARSIGHNCETQLRLDEAKKWEKERVKLEGGRSRVLILARRLKTSNPRTWRKWLSKLNDVIMAEWDYGTKVQIGTILLDILIETLPHIMSYKTVYLNKRGQLHEQVHVQLSDDFVKRMADRHENNAMMRPWLTAMIVPPRPWEWDEEAGKYVGGYLRLPCDIVRSTMNKHTASELKNGYINDDVAEAISAIQNTPWQVNRYVLDLVNKAVSMNLEALLPVAGELEVPAKVSAKEWAKLNDRERGAIKSKLAQVHAHNAKTKDRRVAMYRKLVEAEAKVDYDKIYFPHSLDFRSRIYPIPQDLNPQGDDLGKALLRFADAVPLGPKGLDYLSYHVANVYGEDKGSRQDQLNWVHNNIQKIMDMVSDPFVDGYEFLKTADKPWQFLAACKELTEALAMDNPADYISQLPVAIDGSNNGLQHLAAMSHDLIGARATNLVGSEPNRQDIYREVLARVNEAIETDKASGVAEAFHWSGKTCRTTVKRAVMTRPYGLTKQGASDQLMSDKGICTVGDGHARGLEGELGDNVRYMRDKIWEAMAATVGGADQVMTWLQDCANVLSDQEKSVVWHTPIGFRVVQGYQNKKVRKISTVMGVGRTQNGRVSIWEADGTLAKSQQRNGISPNIVHSFDAAHLLLTALACKDAGISSIAVIHDSYGTHAGNVPALAQFTRETFHAIYSDDWLDSLYQDFVSTGAVNVPKPPAKGTYNIDEVLTSEFFFA